MRQEAPKLNLMDDLIQTEAVRGIERHDHGDGQRVIISLSNKLFVVIDSTALPNDTTGLDVMVMRGKQVGDDNTMTLIFDEGIDYPL